MASEAEGTRTVNRPMSPHLQVYRPQWTSVLSITHRLTGVALAVGTLLWACWLIAAGTSAEAFDAVQSFIGSWFGLLLLFGWTLALFYHLANGIRHLFWDAGMGFELKTAEMSGRAVLIATVVLTLLSWIIGLAA